MSQVKTNKTVGPDGLSISHSSVLLKRPREKKPKAFRIITTSLAKDKKIDWFQKFFFPKTKQNECNEVTCSWSRMYYKVKIQLAPEN